MSDAYLHGHDPTVLASHRWRDAQNSAGYLLDSLRESDLLLDLGCGPGTITRDLAELVPDGLVIALDRTKTIVDEAVGVSPGTLGVVADGYHLPFSDNSIDVVHAHQVLQHVAHPRQVIAEMTRVARRVIAFADADYDRMMWWPNSEGLERWMQLYQEIAARSNVDPNIGRRLPDLAHQCGLHDLTIGTNTWTYAGEALTLWWGTSWAGRVLHSTYATEVLRWGLATSEELTEIASAWRTWSRQPGSIFVIVSVTVLAQLETRAPT